MTSKISIIVCLIICGIVGLGFFSNIGVFVPVSNQWAMQTTQIDKLHALGFDGSGITIGIIDTGVDSTHPEFDKQSFISWFDAINYQNAEYDDDDHGTHVMGILAAKTAYEGLFSGYHLQGIVPNATFIMVKSIPKNQYQYGGGNDTTISQGILFCLDHGADIIFLSLGLSPEGIDFKNTSKTEQAIHDAVTSGVFVVVAAGNDGHIDDGDVCFPASLQQVISVGSISKNGIISGFSSRGYQHPSSQNPDKKPELVAPGEDILSTRIHGTYGAMSGTSQAAAYVVGILGLLLEAYPAYRHSEKNTTNLSTLITVKDVLVQTALKIGNLHNKSGSYSHDDLYGYGLVQAYAAYQQLALID